MYLVTMKKKSGVKNSIILIFSVPLTVGDANSNDLFLGIINKFKI